MYHATLLNLPTSYNRFFVESCGIIYKSYHLKQFTSFQTVFLLFLTLLHMLGPPMKYWSFWDQTNLSYFWYYGEGMYSVFIIKYEVSFRVLYMSNVLTTFPSNFNFLLVFLMYRCWIMAIAFSTLRWLCGLVLFVCFIL